jgi:CBS-domain-containing membrane protein
MGPTNEISHTFDHLLTQLAQARLRVKVLKCKFWSPLGIFLGIKILQSYTLVTYGLHILVMPMGFQNFAMHFLDEALF